MVAVRDAVRAELVQLLREEGVDDVAVGDDTVLLESGLDSLGLAVLVTRLEDRLGYDPFTLMTEAVYPQTLGELATVYETHRP